jgi:hypothetical protein
MLVDDEGVILEGGVGRTSEIGIQKARLASSMPAPRQAVAVRQVEQEGLGDQVPTPRAVRIIEAFAPAAQVALELSRAAMACASCRV